jgi:hypothetical protein
MRTTRIIASVILALVAGGGSFAAGTWVGHGQCTVVAVDPSAAREEQRRRDIDDVLRANPDRVR